MRYLFPSLALTLLLAGCTMPVLPTITGEQTSQEGVITSDSIQSRPTIISAKDATVLTSGTSLIKGNGGNVVAAGGGNVVAAGGGNVVAAGGGNVVAAGGGNVVAAGGGNVVAAGGGNLAANAPIFSAGGSLVASGSSPVIAAGGMNLAAPTGGGLINGDIEGPMTPTAPVISLPGTDTAGPTGPSSAPSPTLGKVKGLVKAPGGLVGRAEDTVPVAQTFVSVYNLAGQRLLEPVKTNDQGAFELIDVPTFKLLCLRTQFTFNGKDYYLSTLVRLEGGEGEADLTPIATLAEAQFFVRCPGTAPADTFIGEAYLDAFWAASNGLHRQVSGQALEATATLEVRSAAYRSLAMQHVTTFKNDINAAFDGTATTAPAGPAPSAGGGLSLD